VTGTDSTVELAESATYAGIPDSGRWTRGDAVDDDGKHTDGDRLPPYPRVLQPRRGVLNRAAKRSKPHSDSPTIYARRAKI
jgi:hypothetical protein